jgi:hypothetical protein
LTGGRHLEMILFWGGLAFSILAQVLILPKVDSL